MKLAEYCEQLQHDPGYLAAEEELRPLLDLADAVIALRLARGWSQAEYEEINGPRPIPPRIIHTPNSAAR